MGEEGHQVAAMLGGFTEAMGVRFVSRTTEEVVLEIEVGDQHKQPFGLVHGGVYCGLVETACSVGAMAHVGEGMQVVGVENHTSFLRSADHGVLRTVARPLHIGKKSQFWQADVYDADQRLLASGRLRLFCVSTRARPSSGRG